MPLNSYVDRTEKVPLPACPDCHGKLRKRKTHENFAIETPPVRSVVIKYLTESGYCPHCPEGSPHFVMGRKPWTIAP